MRPLLQPLLYRWKTKLFDWSFHAPLSWLTAGCLYFAAVSLRPVAPSLAFSSALSAHYLLMRSGRYDASSSRFYARVEGSIAAALARWPDRAGIGRTRSRGRRSGNGGSTDTLNITGLVLKMPRWTGARVTEKGVLLLANNERAHAFAERVDMPALLADYALVLETSWAGYANRDILYFAQFTPHRVIVMASDERDRQFLERLGANLHPVTFGSSDWVNPEVFRPLAGMEKRFDAVMVARWSLIKRHHALFRAVRSLGDPSFFASRWSAGACGSALRALRSDPSSTPTASPLR